MPFLLMFPTRDSFLEYVKEQAPYLEEKVTWSTGGVAGGSCWGGNNYHYSTSEPEPELTEFDNFLEKLFPDITFLKYRDLIREDFIRMRDYTRYEYYGNSTDYVEKWIDLNKLYDALVKVL